MKVAAIKDIQKDADYDWAGLLEQLADRKSVV